MEKHTISQFDNLDMLNTQQPQGAPFAFIKARTIQIYPEPDVSVTA